MGWLVHFLTLPVLVWFWPGKVWVMTELAGMRGKVIIIEVITNVNYECKQAKLIDEYSLKQLILIIYMVYIM